MKFRRNSEKINFHKRIILERQISEGKKFLLAFKYNISGLGQRSKIPDFPPELVFFEFYLSVLCLSEHFGRLQICKILKNTIFKIVLRINSDFFSDTIEYILNRLTIY